MNCLIIAAGKGSRLSNRSDSKPLVTLLGLSLIERVILTASKAGLNDFYVVTGYNGEKVRDYLDRFSLKRDTSITHIINDEWEKENGLSVLKAKEVLKENFILLMADHFFDPSILLKLKEEKIRDEEVMLAVDHGIKGNKLVDINDVTKVHVKDNHILDIGKNIKTFNAHDTGIFLCSPAIFSALEESMHNGNSTLSGAINVLAGKGKARTFNVKDGFWVDVDDDKALIKAESRLLSMLKKPSDGPVSRHLNRPISLRITKHFFLKTGITPNLISIFSFLLSLLAASFFLLGGYIHLVIGAILTQVSSVIDGCDGEVARLRFRSTDFGGWFDAVLDRYADGFLLFGLTYYVYNTNSHLLVFIVGFLALIGTFMNSYTADKYDGFMKKKLVSGENYFRMGRDVRMFIIFLGALLNQPFLILIFIALMMNIVNIRRVVVLYKNG